MIQSTACSASFQRFRQVATRPSRGHSLTFQVTTSTLATFGLRRGKGQIADLTNYAACGNGSKQVRDAGLVLGTHADLPV